MINKFPYIEQDVADKIKEWLDREYNRYMAEHHMYAAFHNNECAMSNKERAGAMSHIKMMMDWHMENKEENKEEMA